MLHDRASVARVSLVEIAEAGLDGMIFSRGRWTPRRQPMSNRRPSCGCSGSGPVEVVLLRAIFGSISRAYLRRSRAEGDDGELLHKGTSTRLRSVVSRTRERTEHLADDRSDP